MPHLHTKPGEYDHTASAYIVRLDGNEPRLLLHLHKKLKVFLQFGGHIETTETPWQAVTHEILEESGYQMNQLVLLQPKERLKKMTNVILHPVPVYHNTHKFDETHFHTDVAYAFITSQEPSGTVEGDESASFKLVTKKELAAMPQGEIYESVRETGLYVLEHCLNHWEEVDPSEFNKSFDN